MDFLFNYIITFLEVYGLWCIIGLVFVFFMTFWIRTAIESRMKKEVTIWRLVFYNGLLIIVTDGFVFSLDKTNGNLNWLTRM